jgi:hypothetical protein
VRKDFDAVLSANTMMDVKSAGSIYKKFEQAIPLWNEFMVKGFLPAEMIEEYKEIILERAKRLGIA